MESNNNYYLLGSVVKCDLCGRILPGELFITKDGDSSVFCKLCRGE